MLEFPTANATRFNKVVTTSRTNIIHHTLLSFSQEPPTGTATTAAVSMFKYTTTRRVTTVLHISAKPTQ